MLKKIILVKEEVSWYLIYISLNLSCIPRSINYRNTDVIVAFVEDLISAELRQSINS